MYFGSHHGKRFALSDSKEACPLLGEEACPSLELVTAVCTLHFSSFFSSYFLVFLFFFQLLILELFKIYLYIYNIYIYIYLSIFIFSKFQNFGNLQVDQLIVF